MYFETVTRAPGADWLLLVHGLMASRNNWRPNLERLSAAFNLVVVDLPGHGRSPAPADPDAWTPDAMVAMLDDIRAGLGLDRWCLCGQSFGAGLTIRYALSHPQRVPAQVFTNARTVFRDESDPAEQAARDARAAAIRQGGREALRNERFHPRFAHRFPADLRAQLCADAEAMDLDGYARILDTTLPMATLRHRARDCRVPSLLVNGRHERQFQPVRARMDQLWPDLEVVDIDGGHAVNIENAEGFDAATLDFLSRHAVSASVARDGAGAGPNPDL